MNQRTREIMNQLTDLRERLDQLQLQLDQLEYLQEKEFDQDTQEDIWCVREAQITLRKKFLGWTLQWEHDIAMIHFHG